MTGATSSTNKDVTVVRKGSIVGPLTLSVNEYVNIHSKKRISVGQFLAGGTSSENHKDVAMLMVAPEELWREHYIFTTPKNSIAGFKHYIVVVIATASMTDLR